MPEELENTEQTTPQEEKRDERLESRKKKSETRKQQAIVRTLLIIGILVLVNIIFLNISFFRADLTANRLYTLSDASKNIVENLDDKLVIKSYFTDDLPAPYNNSRRYLEELLEDYKNYSNNLDYEIISPADELKLEEDAQKFGITPVQVQTFKNDRAEALKAYMGVVLLYGGKQEVLPFIGNISNLEYEITGAIRRLTVPELKKVGVLQGAPDMPGVERISRITQVLSKYYNIINVDASKNQPIPPDIAALIVFTPKAAQQQQQMMQQPQQPSMIPDAVKFQIDQYVMRGGRVIFLMNRVNLSQQQQFQIAQISGTGLEDMLDEWGIRVNSNIVKDKECAYVQVPVQGGPFQMFTQVPFIYYPKITNINRDLASFTNIGQVFLSLTNDIDINHAGNKGINAQPLLLTSNKSAVDKEISLIQVTGQLPSDTIFNMSNLVVGAVYNGSFNSFYRGKQIPADTVSDATPPVTSITEQSPENKIVVIGNGEFVLDEFRGPDENIIFFSSLIDFMTDDIGLSEIRGKDANPPPLTTMDDSLRRILKWGLLVVPPGLVLLYGLLRWKKRKTKKGE